MTSRMLISRTVTPGIASGMGSRMASRTMMAWVVMAFAVLGSTAALAERGTEQQREACTPDAFRLCSQFFPDGDRVEVCLRNAGPRLSPACRVVFYPPATQPQAGVRERGPRVREPMPPPPEQDDDDQ